MTRRKKTVFIGDSGVGKTSILLTHDGRSFDTIVSNTIGANFIMSSVQIGTESVELQIWDTAGQERHRSMVPMYLRGSSAIIIVYDITQRSTFDNLAVWMKDISDYLDLSKVELVILGNKSDLELQREVQQGEAETYAKTINASFFETSARTHSGIEEAITGLAKNLLERDKREKNQIPDRSTSFRISKKDGDRIEKEKTKCCSSL